jgi:hypothetical protein
METCNFNSPHGRFLGKGKSNTCVMQPFPRRAEFPIPSVALRMCPEFQCYRPRANSFFLTRQQMSNRRKSNLFQGWNHFRSRVLEMIALCVLTIFKARIVPEKLVCKRSQLATDKARNAQDLESSFLNRREGREHLAPEWRMVRRPSRQITMRRTGEVFLARPQSLLAFFIGLTAP